MAKEPIKGLRISLKMTDVIDKEQALSNINLNIDDLDRIRGVSESGVLPEDISTISGLESDLEKELVGIYSETSLYDTYLDNILNTGDSKINQNLTANAIVSASSFKYNILDSNGSIVSSDISTSRQSAWSFLANTFYYGGTVEAEKDITLSSINIDQPVRIKEFEAEFPTHTIRFKMNGEDYYAYAMKNIPLRFSGNFSDPQYYRVAFTYNNANPGFAAPYLRPSVVITKKSDGSITTFKDIGSLGGPYNTPRYFSSPQFRANEEGERDIDLYYPASGILSLDLGHLSIYSLPKTAIFSSLKDIDLFLSDLKEMPNFRKIAPNLEILKISFSKELRKSDNLNIRNFNNNVVDLLPTTLKSLEIGGSYEGLTTANLDIISSLENFHCRTTSAFGRLTGISPSVNKDTIKVYDISSNDFSELHPSVYTSPSLKTLNIRGNGKINVPFSITSNVIESIDIGSTSLAPIDVSNKTTLKTYTASNLRSASNTVVTGYFLNCSALTGINISSSNVSGPLPNFNTNTSLQNFSATSTFISNADATYAINATTLGEGIEGGCRKTLSSFHLQSGPSSLFGNIHPNAFDGLIKLRYFTLSGKFTAGSGITGTVPSFNQSSLLETLDMSYNSLSGQLPLFTANPKLRSLTLSYNNFSGEATGFSLNDLSRLDLDNNEFTSVGFLNCPNLNTLYLQDNLLTSIPNLSGCPKLRVLLMDRNPLDSIEAYVSGNILYNTSLTFVYLRSCGIKRNFVDQILIDLSANYDLKPRSGVLIDLVGNEAPSSNDTMQINIIGRLRAAGWTIRLV